MAVTTMVEAPTPSAETDPCRVVRNPSLQHCRLQPGALECPQHGDKAMGKELT